MPTSKILPYDVIIIGAGINGCSSAYFLHQAGLKVALVDQAGIASGGSGAAGAFISPKISKEGALKAIMEEAHAESLAFYAKHFPDYTLLKPLLHIGKTAADDEMIEKFRTETRLSLKIPDDSITASLTQEARSHSSLYFSHGAVVDAVGVCHTLSRGIDFYPYKVDSLEHTDGMWNVGKLRAKHVVLAIGAYPKLVDIPYLTLRGIWGHRIDVETTSDVPCIVHHHVSISPTNNQTIAIGATHDVHFSPFENTPYDVDTGRAELLERASKTLKLDNIKVLKDYMGLRSGSNDYLPLLGALVDARATIELHPQLRYGRAVSDQKYVYYPNLMMINGSGGYGFVLAPYLARRLSTYLAEGKAIDTQLQPSRFFTRWVKSKKG